MNLGDALKSAREARGISLRKLAVLIGRKESDSGLISRWEGGERQPKPEDVAAIVEALDISDDVAAELMALATNAGQSGRWHAVTVAERRQQMNALLAAERTATTVTHLAPLLIPGVLQTSAVIRAIMVDADVPLDEIDERVAIRIGRRDLITRKSPANLDVVLGEAAIRHVIGGAEVWAEQLTYLAEMIELPNVQVSIIPFDAGWTPVLTGSFILFDSDQAPSIISLELHRGGLMLYAEEDIAVHRQKAEAARGKAMSKEKSLELIAKVKSELLEATK
ncbi:Helix-turn-helix domain-containing protein [Amycolatopsis pretoriensis]|uniref:Helix-turn-helix domain-containing protein n=1 Tax=Amycolatopsis pretoriensis TaxID=218821 RepID=A0A1H5RLJ6_9PSEU|nr:helix-turn-helix transcriptional regulator [Amycolatopsis pretoriensis]SEF38387.1 Helix-turn-helix domain-containing protein [Amycolatopsis pretoriensis]